jgi:hypothetical protein
VHTAVATVAVVRIAGWPVTNGALERRPPRSHWAMWYVDIGDRVAAGTLLAQIDTPELDRALPTTFLVALAGEIHNDARVSCCL